MRAPLTWVLSSDALWLGAGMHNAVVGASGFFPNTWRAAQLRRNLKP
jgi:hypothetical protein